MYRTLSVFAALLAYAANAPAASAQADGEQRRITVHYGDLDLSRPGGQQALIARLSDASAIVCGPAPDIRQLAEHKAFKACIKETMDIAVASLGSPEVADAYGLKPLVIAAQ